jgi:hypothetical protein
LLPAADGVQVQVIMGKTIERNWVSGSPTNATFSCEQQLIAIGSPTAGIVGVHVLCLL